MGVVTRVVALILLLAYAGQGAVDSMWCPDGCQDAAAQHATDSNHPSAPGVCLFCGTGFVVTALVLHAAPTFESPRAAISSSDSIPAPDLHAIDHPPRLS
jgi:hypothetical protein